MPGFFNAAHPFERDAEENGYILIGAYDTKDEIDHVISKIHGCGCRAFKAHHTLKRDGLHYDTWALYIKKDDMYKLHPDYVKPPKPKKKRPVKRGGRRKDMAIKIIKMRKEDHMEWEDIAEELERTVSTVQYYFYHYSSEKCRGQFTDWEDERRPEGYDPETGLIRSENETKSFKECHTTPDEDIPQT